MQKVKNTAEPLIQPRLSPSGLRNYWALFGKDVRRDKHLYVLLAPYMVLFLLFTVLPVAISIIFSFTHFNMLEMPRWIGWENYSKLLWNDDVFLIGVKNTLIFSVVTGPVSYIACFLFAWLINELNPKLRAFMTLIFLRRRSRGMYSSSGRSSSPVTPTGSSTDFSCSLA